jgi:hypothetical protein
MPATYEPIVTTTLGSAAASITFSSIASSWTDLRVVLVCTTSAEGNPFMRFNSDTGTNYSNTFIRGDGTTAGSSRGTSTTRGFFDAYGISSTTVPNLYTADIFSYTGSTNKTWLATGQTDKNGDGAVQYLVGLWRNTSAITSILIANSNGNLNTGTTATLYGIKNA